MCSSDLRFLGPRTPVASLEAAVAVVAPDLLVLAGTAPGAFDVTEADQEAVRRLAGATRVVIAGAVADEAAAQRWGAEVLAGDPVTAARSLVGTGRRVSRQGPADGTSS